MKRIIPYMLVIAGFAAGCSPYVGDLATKSCSEATQASASSTRESALQILGDLTRQGVPGAVLSIQTPEASWSVAQGLAKVEDKTPMALCHLQYLQSISKTYLAVCLLKLYEENKLDLDAPMTKYLPEKYSRYIDKPSTITIRMLMNHTSGIPEYNSVPAYITQLLQHPDRDFTAEDYLKYIDGKPLDFAPASKYSYRNTNYVVLALIVDAITGDHARYMQEVIFTPLGLANTFYRNDAHYLDYPQLVNTYWDRYSDGLLENVSVLQRNNVRALIGDDGVVTTPEEALAFLKGLMQGKLLKPSTLDLMKSWANDSKGNPTYGLGLDYGKFDGHTGYGHSGGGLGAGCQLYYFPEKDTYMFVAINLGTVTESPLHKQTTAALEKLYKLLLD
ncbi:serine hydrolase domain-containing protein [Chryseolinea soli]|nr:serine hydrolase domain-containing protein [Chryseolinea soli]